MDNDVKLFGIVASAIVLCVLGIVVSVCVYSCAELPHIEAVLKACIAAGRTGADCHLMLQ